MSRSTLVIGIASAALIAAAGLGTARASADATGPREIGSRLARARVPFVENRGQITDARVAYHARTFSASVVVEDGGALAYQLRGIGSAAGAVIRERFSSEALSATGVAPSSVAVSYFLGRDPSAWRSALPCFDAVSLGEISDGVSLVLEARHDNVEKIFSVAPGADPNAIAVAIDGADALALRPSGELELQTASGPIRFSAPIAYQVIDDARRAVEVAYALHGDAGYGFAVGDYDRTHPLVIDPIIASTYIGRRSTDTSLAIAVDPAGNVYVAGQSQDAASSSPYQTTAGSYSATILGDVDIYFGGRDVVVSKFDPTLGQLLASTYIGGTSAEGATAMVLELGVGPMASDHVVVAGLTGSDDFPTTANAFDEVYNGSSDVFVLRLSDDLSSLLDSTYVGGSHMENAFEPNTDRGPDMVIDATGNIYVAGTTYSFDFPMIPAAKDEGYAPFQDAKLGDDDAFVVKLSNDLTRLLGWTYLGGGNEDRGTAVAVDNLGHVFVSGHTESAEDWAPAPYQAFPITPVAFDATHNSRSGAVLEDGFVSRFDADLETLEASTFIGGDREDQVWDIAVDPIWGAVFIVGETGSFDFPTTAGAYMPDPYAGKNGFVAKLDGWLSVLGAGTHLGGYPAPGSPTYAETNLYAITLDDFGTAWVTGYTYDDYQPTFPVTIDLTDPLLPPWYDPIYYGWKDVVLGRFDRHLRWLYTGLHVGGSDHQQAWAVVTRSFRPGEPEEDYVEVSVAGWSDNGRAADRFYPVFYNDVGYVDSFDNAADYDDVLVTTFSVVPEPGVGVMELWAVVVLAGLAARRGRSGAAA